MRTGSATKLNEGVLYSLKLLCLLKKSDNNVGHYVHKTVVVVRVRRRTGKLKHSEVVSVKSVKNVLNLRDYVLKLNTERALKVKSVLNSCVKREEKGIFSSVTYERGNPLFRISKLNILSLNEGIFGRSAVLTAGKLYRTADIHTLELALKVTHTDVVKSLFIYGELVCSPLSYSTVGVLSDDVEKLRVGRGRIARRRRVIVGGIYRRVGNHIRKLSLKTNNVTLSGIVTVSFSLVYVLLIGINLVNRLLCGNKGDRLEYHRLSLSLKGYLIVGRAIEIELEVSFVVTAGILTGVGAPNGNLKSLRKHRVSIDVLSNLVLGYSLHSVLYNGNDFEVSVLINLIALEAVTGLVGYPLTVGHVGRLGLLNGSRVIKRPRLIKGNVTCLLEGSSSVNKELTLNCGNAALRGLAAVIFKFKVIVSLVTCRNVDFPGNLTRSRKIKRVTCVVTEILPVGIGGISVSFAIIVVGVAYKGGGGLTVLTYSGLAIVCNDSVGIGNVNLQPGGLIFRQTYVFFKVFSIGGNADKSRHLISRCCGIVVRRHVILVIRHSSKDADRENA